VFQMWVRDVRGGNWDNTSNAGVFALNLNNARSIVNNNVGFRPACACVMFLERMSLLSASSVTDRSLIPVEGLNARRQKLQRLCVVSTGSP
jgi:hypothetical protein